MITVGMRIRIKKYFYSVTDPYPTSEENTFFFRLFFYQNYDVDDEGRNEKDPYGAFKPGIG